MNNKQLQEKLAELPDDFDVRLFAGRRSFEIVNVGQTGTVFDKKTRQLKRPEIILIDGK